MNTTFVLQIFLSFFKNCLSFSRYLFSRIYLGGNLSTNWFKTWHRALWRIQGLGLYFSSVIYSNTSKCSQSSYVKSSFWFYLCYGLCFKKISVIFRLVFILSSRTTEMKTVCYLCKSRLLPLLSCYSIP